MIFGRPRPMVVHIEAKITWQIARDPGGSAWIGVCPALNLNARGETWNDLTERANEAIQLLFTDLYEEGELDAFLRSRGWQQRPTPGRDGPPRFDVPFDMRQEGRFEDLMAAHG